MREMWLLSLLALAAGCGTDKEPADEDDDDDTGILPGGNDEHAPFALEVIWGEDTVELDINGGADGNWWFGMAETGNEDTGWVGEDCIGGDGTFSYCHHASTTGVKLTYGAAEDDVREGETTHFPDRYIEPFITYFVENTATEECWVWGDDVLYYKDYDCVTWTPGGDSGEPAK